MNTEPHRLKFFGSALRSSRLVSNIRGCAGASLVAVGLAALTAPVFAQPAITSANYDAGSGVLAVTATGITTGDTITVSKLTLTGEASTNRVLTTADVTASSGTAFSVTLNAADKTAVDRFFNKNGATSTTGTTYNLAADDDWDANVPTGNTSDATNPVTLSNAAVPTIASATYNATTGVLVVTGTGFHLAAGGSNDITSLAFTFVGESGVRQTPSSSGSFEITDSTSFSITLSAGDKATLNQIINKAGSSSTSGTTYSLVAAEDWDVGADAAATIADLSGKPLTVSNVPTPAITSATYDAGTGILVVTGAGFLKFSGAANDIVVSNLTLTGEGGSTYALTSGNVEIASGTSFSVTLNSTDEAAINGLLNKDGTSSTGGTTYNLAAAEDWAAGADSAITVADATSSVTAIHVAIPTLTSATYNGTSLTVTGTGMAAGDTIVVSKLTLTGDAGATYTLTGFNVAATNATTFTVGLSGTPDQTALRQLFNKNGTSSTEGTTYNLAAADDWDAASTVGDNSDATNAVTVSAVGSPSINSAVYDFANGVLTATGNNLQPFSGAANDVVVSKLTLKGEATGTYTLTSADVEITSATSFKVTLNPTDKTAVNALLNKDGTSSVGGTTYNLAAAEDWDAGADPAATIADATTIVTVAHITAPSIASATYSATSGSLTVTGTGMSTVDTIDVGKLTLTGEGGATATIANTANVNASSATAFTVTLSAVDRLAVGQMLNKNGTSSTGGTTYNLAAADDWNTALTSGDTSVTTAAITVSNALLPRFTSAIYNSSTGVLTVNGSNLLKLAGAANDIDVTKLTLTGQGGATYTLTSSSVDILNETTFVVTLNGTDKSALASLLDKDGSAANDNTIYNLAAGEDWAAGADAGVTTADLTGNAVFVNNGPVTGLMLFAPTNTDSTTRIFKVNSDGTLTTVTTIALGVFGNYAVVRGDQKFAYITSRDDNSVRVIDATSLTAIQTANTESAPHGIAVSPDGLRLYVANRTSSSISVFTIDASTGLLTRLTSFSTGVGTNPRGIAIGPDGTRLYVVNQTTNSLSVFNTTDFSLVANMAVGTQPLYVGISPNGSRAYVSNYSSSNVSVVDTTTNTVLTTIPVGSGPDGVIVSPNGAYVFTANRGGANVSVIDTASNTVLSHTPSGATTSGIALDPDGSALFTSAGGGDNWIKMFSVNSGTGAITPNGSPSTIAAGTGPSYIGMVRIPGPTITAPANGNYATGQTLSFTATFTAAVNVTGTPQLPLTIGTASVNAGYVSGHGTTTLTFTYTVQAGDTDTDGIAIVSPLSLNGGTITNVDNGFNAGVFFAAPNTTGVLVNATSSANLPPTDIALSASSVDRSAGVNAVVGTLSSTDADSVSFTYTLVGGAGATDNGSFNISGSSLRVNDASQLVTGNYSVRIRTADDQNAWFEKVFSITVADEFAWRIVGSGDFDGDGHPDIVWENRESGRRVLWLMNNGIIAGFIPTSIADLGYLDPNWQIVGRGDFNGDGQTDVLLRNVESGDCGLWIMNGTAPAAWVNLPSIALDWRIVGTGDFNGDGQTDIVWENSGSGDHGLWIMNGTVPAAWVNLPSIVSAWRIVGAGDFNGDGQTDVLWENSGSGDRGLWIMNGTVPAAWVNLPSIVPAWRIVGAGDFNGDGQMDILWENSGSGNRGLWIMNGTVPAAWINLPLSALD